MSISEEYLKEFDYLNDIVYLDWACMGVSPNRTRKFCREFLDDFCEHYAQVGHTKHVETRENTRREIASLIGAEPEEIYFTPNTSAGNGAVSAYIEAREGDNVIAVDMDYPGLVYPWTHKKGIEVRLAASENGAIDEKKIIELMDEHTRAVAISFVQYGTGYKADLKLLGEECSRRGILLTVDGIQGIGRNPINVKECKIDLLSCGCYKGLMGVFGIAFVYCKKELLKTLVPPGVGYNCVIEDMSHTAMLSKEPLPLFEDYQRMEPGTVNNYGIGALGESLSLIKEIGVDAIKEHITGLEKRLREGIKAELPQVKLLGSEDPAHWSGNLCMTFDPEYTQKFEERLRENRVYATVDPGYCRMAFHYCNSERDVDVFLKALRETF